MREKVRTEQSGAATRPIGALRFGLLILFTFALAVVIGRTIRLSCEGTSLAIARYPAHAILVVWVAAVGTLWLRLQEMSEASGISPVRTARRIILASAVAISSIPQDVIANVAMDRPLLAAGILWAGVFGLMVWQNPWTGRVHRFSSGMESLALVISTQLMALELGRYDPHSGFAALCGLGGTMLGAALAVKARQTGNGRVYATTALCLIAAEILIFLAWPMAASSINRS